MEFDWWYNLRTRCMVEILSPASRFSRDRVRTTVKANDQKALPANDSLPHPKLGIDQAIHLPASWLLARLKTGNIFCASDYFDQKAASKLLLLERQKDWTMWNDHIHHVDALVLTSPRSAREWGYGGSQRGLSLRARRPAGRKGTGTAWGDGWRPFASAPGTYRTLGKCRMQVCRKQQGERKETFKEGGETMSIWKNSAEDCENMCDGQEQSSSCFWSVIGGGFQKVLS